MTSCNEVAVRIEPITHQGKLVNAQRSGGKLILMVDWEPAFVKFIKNDNLIMRFSGSCYDGTTYTFTFSNPPPLERYWREGKEDIKVKERKLDDIKA
jgi:hypothetical protein